MNFYITVNNREIEAVKGETILQALRRSGIGVPTLCNMEGFTPTGACRLCMVEVTGRRELVPACSSPVEEWMEVSTHSNRVVRARKSIVELLLQNHPDDCLYCERNGNCELQDLAASLNIRERKHGARKIHKPRDLTSPAIIRDPAKCVLCGRCVRVCEEVMACSTLEFSGKGSQSGITTTWNRGLNNSTCIACGQCVMACPTAALYEKKHLAELHIALDQKDLYPVAIIDNTVSVTLADINGNRNLRTAARQLNAALKKCGFREVYDLSSANDLYVRKIAGEVVSGRAATLLSSNCPAWIRFAEQFLPGLLKDISVHKSPQQMAGSIIKHLHKKGSVQTGEPKPFLVHFTACTARKMEAQRKEYIHPEGFEADMVITTRTLREFIRLHGIDANFTEQEDFNKPFHTSSLHGELMGVAGGTMEAVAETVYYMLTEGKELPEPKLKKSRGSKGVRTAEFTIGRKTFRFAAVSGMADAKAFLEVAMESPGKYQFIEVMACPGGCVNGGGQPIMEERYRVRQRVLTEMADKNAMNGCYHNRTLDDLLAKLPSGEAELNALLNNTFTPPLI